MQRGFANLVEFIFKVIRIWGSFVRRIFFRLPMIGSFLRHWRRVHGTLLTRRRGTLAIRCVCGHACTREWASNTPQGIWKRESLGCVTPSTFRWTWPTLCPAAQPASLAANENVTSPFPSASVQCSPLHLRREQPFELPAPDRYITKYSCSCFNRVKFVPRDWTPTDAELILPSVFSTRLWSLDPYVTMFLSVVYNGTIGNNAIISAMNMHFQKYTKRGAVKCNRQGARVRNQRGWNIFFYWIFTRYCQSFNSNI